MKKLLLFSLVLLNSSAFGMFSNKDNERYSKESSSREVKTTSIATHIVEQKNIAKGNSVAPFTEASNSPIKKSTSSISISDDSYDDYMKDRSSN